MARRTKIQTVTNEDFEAKAEGLLHMALIMSEERLYVATKKRKAPIGLTLAEAAMTLNYAMRTFLSVSRLQGR